MYGGQNSVQMLLDCSTDQIARVPHTVTAVNFNIVYPGTIDICVRSTFWVLLPAGLGIYMGRVFLESLTAGQLIKKLPACYRTLDVIAVFTRTHCRVVICWRSFILAEGFRGFLQINDGFFDTCSSLFTNQTISLIVCM